MGLHIKTALGAVFVAACAIPAGAQAAQKTVDMGLPAKFQKTFQDKYGAEVNAFFPRRITIHRGDSVKFVPLGLHTTDIPPKGKKLLPLVAPTGKKVTGETDAAGVPFWFNGLDVFGFTAPMLKFAFGKTLTYTGKNRVESGLPLADKPKPMVVKFTKLGTHKYYCDVHPGMTGFVRVVNKNRRIPSAKADAKTVAAQVARSEKVAKSLVANAKPAANTVWMGVAGGGALGVEHFGFVPAKLSVPAGTTVRFTMTPQSFEAHTATGGPGDPIKDPKSYVGQTAAAYTKPVFEPSRAVYPSDPPPAAAVATPTSHGNGFWSTGFLDTDPGSPIGPAGMVTFGAPGTYEYHCLIHPFMHGTVTVT